jgi:hypothetical protein
MKPTSESNGFELIPKRVDVVKRIFQMAKDGIGNGTIVKRLNEEGIATFSDKSNGWHPSYIQKLLKNTAVYGEFQMRFQRNGEITPAGEPMPSYFPAIMSKDDWLLVSSIRSDRRTRGGVSKGTYLSNLFSGLLQCGYCNGSMVMGGYVNKKVDGGKRSAKYVACSNGRRSLGCYFIQWNYTELEQQILQFCKSVDFAEVLGKKNNSGKAVEQAQREVIKIQTEIDERESKSTNLLRVLEEGKDQVVPLAILNRLTQIESELAGLKEAKKRAEFFVAELTSNEAERSRQQGAIVELFEQLQKLDGSKLHDLRIRLSQRIKKTIALIGLFPGGHMIGEKRRKTMKDGLTKAGYSKEHINAYLENFEMIPNKAQRYMVIVFKNGESLTVRNKEVRHNLGEMTSIDEYLGSVKGMGIEL